MALGNRSLRILVSVLTIPFILAVTYFGGITFLIFAIAITAIASYELNTMFKSAAFNPNTLLTIILASVVVLNFYFHFIDFGNLILISVPLILLTELFRNKGTETQNIGINLIALFYLAFAVGSLVGIREYYSYNQFIYEQGGYLVIAMLATIWICDSAAYFLGSAFGKHKLFPRVSPNKSWEGAVAGFLFSLVVMIFAQQFLLDFLSFVDALVLGSIIGIFGQIGDLIESLLKRNAGVKDSSSIIPGHGGIFDRFDSLIFVSPLTFIYLTYF